MEVTALKGSGGDVQHFADRIIAERGVRYGRVAMIPTSAKTKRRTAQQQFFSPPPTGRLLLRALLIQSESVAEALRLRPHILSTFEALLSSEAVIVRRGFPALK